ncbi:hypothetical protein [Arthrobacter koreensis]|uniref:hypothetical protein n=1 Tax=Arthrobacter koreensis TaxID=199136 RepID=UPI00381FDE5B
MSTETSAEAAPTVKVKIENSYADGHESEKIVLVAPPEEFDEDSIDEWWNNDVFAHTGDGHSETMDASYEAKVLEGPESLVGTTYEW